MNTTGRSGMIKLELCPEYTEAQYNKKKEMYIMATIRAPVFDASIRAAVDIVAVVDRSGSMERDMRLVQKTLLFIVSQLKERDRLGIVTFNQRVRTDLKLTAMTEMGKTKASSAIEMITTSGQTNLSGGLLRGLDIIRSRDQFDKNENCSLLLFTDGRANLGIKSIRHIVRAMQDPVYMRQRLQEDDISFSSTYDDDKSESSSRSKSKSLPSSPAPKSRSKSLSSNHHNDGSLSSSPSNSRKDESGSKVTSNSDLRKETKRLDKPKRSSTFSNAESEKSTSEDESKYQIMKSPGGLSALHQDADNFEYWKQLNEENRKKAQDLKVKESEKGKERGKEKEKEKVNFLSNQELPCTVYTFGYSKSHNANMLNDICQVGHGVYYYMEDEDAIVTSFAHCLGGLLSVVVQRIFLTFQAENGTVIKKVLYNNSSSLLHGEQYRVSLGDIQSEEEKDILVSVALSEQKRPEERSVLSVKLECFNVISNSHEVLRGTAYINRTDNINSAPGQNKAVVLCGLRVLVAEALAKANRHASEENIEEAKKVLSDAIIMLSESKLSKHFFVLALKKDVLECLDSIHDFDAYKRGGQHKLNNVYSEYHNQRNSRASKGQYSTGMKDSMVLLSKSSSHQ